ncbi:hypothetical protein [Pedobacter aquatilis]|uniref:hypothetical protein n=1 Tax=Pedobacter aquatilis TaxID=351343 RepID=UPI0029306C25|nr:hypothetical protein [Pedobacter aquatilis]
MSDQKMVFEFNQDEYTLISFAEYNLIINLVDIKTNYCAKALIQLQESAIMNGKKLIHLWEDVWLTKPQQVLFRLHSLLGKNRKIHGRKTKVAKITKPEADLFLSENHLQGAVSSRYKLGLFLAEELIAVATFSALRKMNHTVDYKSIELIRFAVKGGYTITGGLSKLIKHVEKALNPDDIMTYADRDWSAGEAYLRLGFEQTNILKPQHFELMENLGRKLITNHAAEYNNTVFNTGSLKFILKF